MDGPAPTRRQLISGLTLTTVLPMVGCLDGNSGQSDTGEEPATDGEKTDSEHLQTYREYLETNEIAVQNLSFDENRRVVSVEYQTEKTDEQELAAEIGAISGGVMQRLRDGWEVQRLEALIIQDNESVATWHMTREWFEEFENGDRSPDELSVAILNTLEFVE